MLLKGKNAIVTGGSRGIGREIVLAFLREGASVWYLDLAEGEYLKEYQDLASSNGATAAFKECNVADEERVQAVISEVISEAGTVDIAVNNAGITRDTLMMRMKTEDWKSVLDVNLTSAFLVSRALYRQMAKQKGGSIINVASIVGIIGNGGQTNYSASKAGLIGMTKSMAREVASRNVRVNAVAPGFIVTPMTDKLNEDQKKALYDQIPMGRLGEPAEVAKTIVFLASDLASYVTGEVIKITGGLGM
ncbi:3-oxoacyl-[acyl-carrier-protein] reductase [Salinispira pacifica]|uniref:3-oxoacyl-[acyl-carrier-protein] reductase n=1 Tax=Salinispira pacifica TaxID=1307761 RepID=UPI00059C76D7|nr:3-oxoacyl-[acyl-carrier-protein] reductase [Salinispira pacifica]